MDELIINEQKEQIRDTNSYKTSFHLMFQGNAGGGTGGDGGTGSSGAFGKLAFSKLKTDPSKKDSTASMDEIPSGKDELEALADSEAEDPIVKAEREFFEIIKQVCILSYKYLEYGFKVLRNSITFFQILFF